MGHDQLIFNQFFLGQVYTLRGDFSPRPWHISCLLAYDESAMKWEQSGHTNGDGARHRFTIFAGTGAGKTQAAANIAAHMLNGKKIDQVVFVCPNRSIRRKALWVFRHLFGIDLVVFHSERYKDGIPRTKQGYILTYAHLIQNPALHRRICGPDTLVIFDEVHHLGDKTGWGTAAVEAFERVKFVLNLTGTPYRSDNYPIPPEFVTYEREPNSGGLHLFKADFNYPLGKCVAETICRKPLFVFHDATVRVRPNPEAQEFTVSFQDKVNTAVSSLRLRGSVQYGSPARVEMLRTALARCRAEGRKVIIFLGGDCEGELTPTEDATGHLPSQLVELGIGPEEFTVVTGDDKEAQEKIEAFGASDKWILVSINMVSEGTDIPEISAAIFLTSVTAKQTTVQRIGRALRLMGDGDRHTDALIFMFEDPILVTLAAEIEDEIKVEVDLARKRKGTECGPVGDDTPRYRAEAQCTGGGEATMVKFGGETYSIAAVEEARRICRSRRLPDTMLNAVLELLMRDVHEHSDI